MAQAFNIRDDLDPDAFIDDQRQEGKGGDRGISLQIIDDVLSNSKGLFEEQGLGDDIAAKLKQLWISKLEAFDCGNEQNNDHLRVRRSKVAGKDEVIIDCKETEAIAKLKRRKKGQRKANAFLQEEENVRGHEIDESSSTSSALAAPKSISSKKKARIGGQVDGPNDTSDEDEDIGKTIIDFKGYFGDCTESHP